MKPDRTLIISVFIVASCGLAYELIIAALASYLLGDSILQFSSIIGLYLFAMGIGAHLTKYIRDEDALSRFIEIELLVGIIGGVSALVLFVVFGLAAAPFRTLLYALVLVVGIVVGMEIPLVMRVLNRRQADFKDLVAKVLTFDYLGALAVSLLFPLVLAPRLGMARSALLFGLLNAAVAVLTAPSKQSCRATAPSSCAAASCWPVCWPPSPPPTASPFWPSKAISATRWCMKAIRPTSAW